MMAQKGLPKSRVGCVACKAKHIKCDEAKPECLTCLKRGITCPGYRRALKWSTKYEVNLNPDIKGPADLSDLASATTSSVVEKSTKLSVEEPQQTPADIQLINISGLSPRLEETTMSTPFLHLESSPSDVLPTAIDFDQAFLNTNTEVNNSIDGFAEAIEHSNEWLDAVWPRTGSTPSQSAILPIGGEDIPILDCDYPDYFEQASTSLRHDDTTSVQTMSVALIRASRPIIGQNISDTSTFLIDNWFENVCRVWSGFDSVTNMNRKLASEAFPHSEALYYSLQSMSAACLAENIPHLRPSVLETAKSAVSAIRRGLAIEQSNRFFRPLPKALLLSMFCLGTSGCWTDARQFGLPFLHEVKNILANFNQRAALLSDEDRITLSYFNESCLWWDMLCNIVTDPDEWLNTRWLRCQSNTVLATCNLHPWTGVSSAVLSLFSQSITLCRRFRLGTRKLRRPTASGLQAALQEIRSAQELDKKVESLQVPVDESIPDTGDTLTPRSHLVDVAKAYRLASLLQLRQTFPDLCKAGMLQNSETSTNEEIRKLALELIRVLQKIPLSSGSLSLQPMLYLTASTGLRFDVTVSEIRHSLAQVDDIFAPNFGDLNSTSDCGSEDGMSSVGHKLITKTCFDIGYARKFVLERLSSLERKLPAKPLLITKELIQQVWVAYDREAPDSDTVHWIDIMEDTGLQTMFG